MDDGDTGWVAGNMPVRRQVGPGWPSGHTLGLWARPHAVLRPVVTWSPHVVWRRVLRGAGRESPSVTIRLSRLTLASAPWALLPKCSGRQLHLGLGPAPKPPDRVLGHLPSSPEGCLGLSGWRLGTHVCVHTALHGTTHTRTRTRTRTHAAWGSGEGRGRQEVTWRGPRSLRDLPVPAPAASLGPCGADLRGPCSAQPTV